MKLMPPMADGSGRRPITRRKAYIIEPARTRNISVAQPRALRGRMT